MNPRDKRDLLSDVFSEGESAATDHALLAQTLQHVRARRRRRKTARAAVALTIIAGMSWSVFSRISPRRSIPLPSSSVSRIDIVNTRRFSDASIVVTTPLDPTQLATTPSSPQFAIVSTRGGYFVAIGDRELLAFTKPGEAILVARDRTHKELIFLRPGNEFPARVE